MSRLTLERLSSRSSIDISQRPDSMRLVYGSKRSAATLFHGGMSLWIPLRGCLRLDVGGCVVRLQEGELLLWNEGGIGTVNGVDGGEWIALVGDVEAWQAVLSDTVPASKAASSVFYPGKASCPRHLRAHLITLARRMCSPARRMQALHSLRSLVLALWELQRPIDALAERCSGHTQLHKRRNLTRLLRVRERILYDPTRRVDLGSLAELANYSSGHFVRAFRDAFNETPVEYASRIRLEHARCLIQTQALSVTDVAELTGFNSVGSFCRSFRRAFGVSASEVKGKALASCRVALTGD